MYNEEVWSYKIIINIERYVRRVWQEIVNPIGWAYKEYISSPVA